MDDDFKRELVLLFATEAAGLLDRIAQGLADLEGASAPGHVLAQLRRELHSLKGGAFSVGLEALGKLSHAMEEAFPADEAPDPVALQAAKRTLGALGEVVQQIARDGREPSGRLTELREQFLLCLSDPGAASDQAPALPAVRAPEDDGVAIETEEVVGRVDLRTLDELAAHLVEARSQAHGLLRHFDRIAAELGEEGANALRAATKALTRSLENANQASVQLRLRPVLTLLGGLKAAFEDALARCNKQGRFISEGGDVLLDRRVAERVGKMLAHLVRNSVDHGFESPEERIRLGKPAAGTLTVKAIARGIRVELVVQDDGRGFDVAALRHEALARGLVDADEQLSRDELLGLSFQPGVSTRDEVSDLSGRGIGLDVVRESVERLNGQVRISSPGEGRGTEVRIEVPVSLATARLLIVARAGQRFAVPMVAAKRLFDLTERRLESAVGRRTLRAGGRRIPVADLASIYRLDEASSASEPLALAVQVGERQIALGLDEVEGEVEAPVRRIGEPLGGLPLTAGLAILGSGEVVTVIDIPELARRVVGAQGAAAAQFVPDAPDVGPEADGALVLVVDDSPATRALQTHILNAAGYRVRTAVDGQEALSALAEGDVDLVVTDVEMPRMTGVQLVRHLRQDEALAHLPVIVVTARSDFEEAALRAGADAFSLKRAFDPEKLLDEVGRLLARRA